MLTIIQQPDDIVLSGNQVVFKIAASDALGNPYKAQAAYINLNTQAEDNFIAGDTLTISWSEQSGINHTYNFTFEDAPVSALDLPASQSGTYQEYLEEILSIILAQRLIGASFTGQVLFNNPSYSIRLTAKNTSTDFIVSSSDTFNNGVTESQALQAQVSTIPNNYAIHVDVFYEPVLESNDYEPVAQLQLSLDSNSEATVDISEVLHQFAKSFQASIPVPAFADDQPQNAQLTKRYFIRFWEDYDGIGQILPTTIAPKFMLFAAIDQLRFAQADFFGGISALSSILSNREKVHTIAPNQPFWIAWYNYMGVARNIVLQITLKNTEGLTAKPIRFSPTTVGSQEVVWIPVGYEQLFLQAEALDNVVAYDVQVLDATELNNLNEVPYSPVWSFFLDVEYQLEQHFVLYLNTFNCPESIRLTGQLKEDLVTTIEESEAILPVDYSTDQISEVVFNPTFEKSYEFTTGFLNKTQVRSIQEMLIDRRIFIVSSKGTIPMNIISNKFSITNTNQFLNALSFKAIKALKERYFSNNSI
jgi:hypothetical protein